MGCSDTERTSKGSGNSQFDQLKGKKGGKKGKGEDSSVSKLEEKILGPSYNYVSHIKTPGEMGMSAEGSFGALADDVSGLLGYMDALVAGNGRLGVGTKTKNANGSFSDYPHPLGNKFFLETAVKCKDADGEEHTRSIYINNVPDGAIPLVSNIDNTISFSSFKGLLPGVISNLAQIHPMLILGAFTAGSAPRCQTVKMEVVGDDNASKIDYAYITNEDIAIMPASWFPDMYPQSMYDLDTKEEFTTMDGPPNPQKKKEDYSQMPDDIVIKFYYSMLGLLGIYILLKLMTKKK